MNAADVLRTFAGEFPGLQAALIVTSAVVGLALIGSAVYEAATYHKNRGQGGGFGGTLMRALSGAAILGLGGLVGVQTVSIFGATDPRSILDYAEPTGSEAAMLTTVLLGVMSLVGWVGIFKGWYILANIGRSPGGNRDGEYWNAGVLLLAGTIAANLEFFSDIVAATFGVENYLRRLIPV